MELDQTQAFLKVAHQKLSEATAARTDLDVGYAKKRADIDAQILKWKRVIDAVLAVAESEQDDPEDVEVSGFVEGKAGRRTIKFTDGVRLCLKQRGNDPSSAPDIRDGLINLGFDFGKYAQPLVPIHNCLKRLVEQGEAEAVKNDEGQIIGYKWISPIEQALAEEYPIGYGAMLGGISVAEQSYRDAQRIAEMHKGTVLAAQQTVIDVATQLAMIEEVARRTKKPKKG